MKVALIVTMLALLPAQTPQQSNGFGTIRGTVVQYGESSPIADVEITFTHPGGWAYSVGVPDTITDSNGRFEIRNVVPGKYVVHAHRSGYVNPVPEGIRLKEGGTVREVTVAANQISENVTLSLVRMAVVAGQVLDPNGRPLPEMSVDARFPTPNSQNLDGAAYYLGAGVNTDEHGEFRIINLEPGKYALSADVNNRRPDEHAEFAKTYFPRSVDISDAALLSLRSGEVREGLVITMQPPRKSFQVSGKLLDPKGVFKPDSSISVVRLIPANSPGPHSNQTIFGNEADEHLEFRVHAFAGRYDLYVDVDEAVAAKTTVEVRDSDISDIALVAGGVEVRGQVVVAGQSANKPKGTPYLTLATENVSTRQGKLDDAGFFTIPEVINGRWKGQWESADDSLVVLDVRQGAESVYQNGFAVGDRPPELIQIVLSPVGSVDGVTAAGAEIVILTPAGGIQRTSSDAAGRFTFPKVAIGEHRVYAIRSADFPTDAMLREFLNTYGRQSQTLTVSTGETARVNVRVVQP